MNSVGTSFCMIPSKVKHFEDLKKKLCLFKNLESFTTKILYLFII